MLPVTRHAPIVLLNCTSCFGQAAILRVIKMSVCLFHVLEQNAAYYTLTMYLLDPPNMKVH